MESKFREWQAKAAPCYIELTSAEDECLELELRAAAAGGGGGARRVRRETSWGGRESPVAAGRPFSTESGGLFSAVSAPTFARKGRPSQEKVEKEIFRVFRGRRD